MNTPKVITSLVAVRNYSREVSSDDKVYYKIELQQFAVKDETGVWSLPTTSITKVNVSDTFHKLWLKDKLSASNILVMSMDEHIKNTTEYVDDEEVKTHTKSGYDVTQALQATIFDLVDVAETVDITKYMSYMQECIRMACIKSERMSR